MPETRYLSSTNSDLTGGADFNKALVTSTSTLATQTVSLVPGVTETSYGFTPGGPPGGGAGFSREAVDPTVFWDDAASVASGNITAVAAGAGYYMVGTSSGQLKYATDPAGPWTDVADPGFSGYQINAIAYGDRYWVAVSSSSAGVVRYATSPEGPWTTAFAYSTPTDVYYGNGYWVVVSQVTNPRAATNPAGPWATITGVSGAQSIAFGGGYWVATGSTPIRYARDLTGTWTTPSNGLSATSGAIYAAGRWIVVGPNGLIATAASPNGTWTQQNSGVTVYLRRVRYQDGYWTIFGYDGLILTSTTGLSFSWATPGTFTQGGTISAGDGAYGDGCWISGYNTTLRYTAPYSTVNISRSGTGVAYHSVSMSRVNAAGVAQATTPSTAVSLGSISTTHQVRTKTLGPFASGDRLRVNYELNAIEPSAASATTTYYPTTTASDLSPFSGGVASKTLEGSRGSSGSQSLTTLSTTYLDCFTPATVPGAGVLYSGNFTCTGSINILTGASGQRTVGLLVGRINAAGVLQGSTYSLGSVAATAGVKTFSSSVNLGNWQTGDRLIARIQYINSAAQSATISVGLNDANTFVRPALTTGPASVDINLNTASAAVDLSWGALAYTGAGTIPLLTAASAAVTGRLAATGQVSTIGGTTCDATVIPGAATAFIGWGVQLA